MSLTAEENLKVKNQKSPKMIQRAVKVPELQIVRS